MVCQLDQDGTYTATNSISTLKDCDFRTMLQQHIRTSQACHARSNNANMRYLAHGSPNHGCTCTTGGLHVSVSMRRTRQILMYSRSTRIVARIITIRIVSAAITVQVADIAHDD